MCNKILILFSVFVLVFLPVFAFSSTEVSYPSIPGAISPQDIVSQAENEKEVFPLFLVYIFNVLLLVSVFVVAGITVYGITVYAMSSNNPENSKKAKEWIINAIQGSLIIFASYALLYTIDSRLVLFQFGNLGDVKEEERLNMQWDLKSTYFQVPLGLIIEDAILNETAESKFYDILNTVNKAEEEADKIVTGGEEIIGFIEVCPIERPCCGTILLANIEDMVENHPHFEEGAESWTEILEIIKDNPEFFEKFAESFKEITGKEITKEDIAKMAHLESLGYDFREVEPEGTDVISSGIDDDGNIFYYYGKTQKPTDNLIFIDFDEVDYFDDIDFSEMETLASMSLKDSLSASVYLARKEPTQEELKRWKEQGFTTLKVAPNCINPWGDGGDIPIDDYVPGEEPEETPEEPEEGEEPECPPCPDINPPILLKIEEIEGYMMALAEKLDLLLSAKEPLKEDLYNIYKVVMLKSLGYENIINYPALLLQKSIYKEEGIITTTDQGVVNIGRYEWSWNKWVSDASPNIEYIPHQNDSATFYLKKPISDGIIEDALKLAKEAKQNDIQSLGKNFKVFNKDSDSEKETILNRFISFLLNIFFQKESSVLAEEKSNEEKLKECIEEKNLNLEELEFSELLQICEIEYDEDSMSWPPYKDPADFLSCGLEIPIGEVIELTWNHLMDILYTVDEYIEEGRALIKLQEHMNNLAAECFCPCEGDEKCSEECGACDLTCNLEEIKNVYTEIIETRANMEEIAERINLLTLGHFKIKTENLCEEINSDIRNEEEEESCQNEGTILITNHELITRKLNFSRFMFDNCITPIDQIESVIMGEKQSSVPVFGPVAEKNNLPRETKTKVEGEVFNTSDFNWFCCKGF